MFKKELVNRKYTLCFPYILITFVVMALYAPTLNNGFFNIDDELLTLDNPYIKDVSWGNFFDVLNPLGKPTQSEKAYKPLRLISFMVDYALGGNNPSVYHTGNVIIYLIICLFLYKCLVEHMKRSALWITILFALHPVHTEPVAWITGRCDLLAALFCLLSFFAYQRSANKEISLTYVISLIFWILAFLSKSVAVILPIVIVGYDICVKSRSWRQNIIKWIPFIFLSSLACFLTIFIAKSTGHIHGEVLPLSNRFLYAALLIQRYLVTSLMPVQLSFYYIPFPDLSLIIYEVVLSISLCLLLLALGLLWWFKNRQLFFILILFFSYFLPVIQLIPFPIMQADRYIFFSVLAIVIIIGWGLEVLERKKYTKLRRILYITVLTFYFSLSWQRIQLWESSVFIWKDAATKSSDSFARMQLGRAYFKEEQFKKALVQFLKVMDEKPHYNGGFYWAGRSMLALENLQKAEFFLKKAKNFKNTSHTNYQLGLIAYREGHLNKADSYLNQAISNQPQLWEGHYLLGVIHLKSGRKDLALEKFCDSLHPSNKHYHDALEMIRQIGIGSCHKK